MFLQFVFISDSAKSTIASSNKIRILKNSPEFCSYLRILHNSSCLTYICKICTAKPLKVDLCHCSWNRWNLDYIPHKTSVILLFGAVQVCIPVGTRELDITQDSPQVRPGHWQHLLLPMPPQALHHS